MQGRLYTLGASGNLIVQIISLLVFGLALIAAVLMGVLVLVFGFGFAVVGAIVFSIRLWWLRRKIARSPNAARQPGGRYIEAEYTVVEERDPEQRN